MHIISMIRPKEKGELNGLALLRESRIISGIVRRLSAPLMTL